MNRIPNEFVSDLVSRIDLVDLVSRHVPLKKRGIRYASLCPFHDEKTPSFFVRGDTGRYRCYGCGASGNAVDFLRTYLGLSYPDAVEMLAREAGVPMPSGETDPGRERKDALLGMLERAASFYQEALARSEMARRLLDERGIGDEAIGAFRIGYAPASGNALLSAFGRSREILREAGLIRDNEGRPPRDFLVNRLVFPIMSGSGRVLGFGGRRIGDTGPKYLNTSESPVFRKRQVLYGEHVAFRGRQDEILVVEGYTDVISLWQSGVRNVVATLGTSLTREHLDGIWRRTDALWLCFDGDEAGRKAADRAQELLAPLLRDGREAGFLFLPDGEDPDSLVRSRGPDAIVDPSLRLRFSERLFRPLRDLVDRGASAEEIAAEAGRVRRVLTRMPPGALRSRLGKDLEEIVGGEIAPAAPRTRKPVFRSGDPGIGARIAAVLLSHPSLAADFLPEIEDLAAGRGGSARTLARIAGICVEHPQRNTGALLECLRSDPVHDRIREVFDSDLPLPDTPESARAWLSDAMNWLRVRIERHALERALASGPRTEEDARKIAEMVARIRRPDRIPAAR